MSDTLTTLQERFKPTLPRNAASTMIVEVGKEQVDMRVNEIAWLPQIAIYWSTRNPLEVTDNSSLTPIVWLTQDDGRLLVRKASYAYCWNYNLLIEKPLEAIHQRDQFRLSLGLEHKFEEIDTEFNTMRRKALANSIDRAIREIPTKKKFTQSDQEKLVVDRLLEAWPDREAFVSVRDKLVEKFLG